MAEENQDQNATGQAGDEVVNPAETSQEGQVNTPEVKNDWWSEGGKYKTPQEAQKAREDTVREMNIRQQEAALLRKENESLKANQVQPKANNNVNQEPPDEVKQALEQKYGKSYAEIKLQFDLNALNEEKMRETINEQIRPLKENLLNQQYESEKKRLNDDVVYQQYPAEFEARLNMLPVSQRVDKQEIKRIRAEILDEKLPEMLLRAKTETAGGRPKTPPAVASGGSAPFDDSADIRFTEAQLVEMRKFNQDPKDMKEYLLGKKPKASAWGRTN